MIQVWHYALPEYLSEQLESIKRRTLRIIYPKMDYYNAITITDLTTLIRCRSFLCKHFLTKLYNPPNKLDSLIPPYTEH